MVGFDINSLFTNVPLTETLHLCVQNLYRNQTHVGKLTQSSFYSLLKISIFESFFIFDWKSYEQCDGVAMGSPLGFTLANVFMCHFKNLQTNCLQKIHGWYILTLSNRESCWKVSKLSQQTT